MPYLNEKMQTPAQARQERDRKLFSTGLLSEQCAIERAASRHTPEPREQHTRVLDSQTVPTSPYHPPVYQTPVKVLKELRTASKAFVTNPSEWRGHSSYFDGLFAGKSGDRQQHESNSYYIETEYDLFVHVLRYLRTGVLPVFYDNVKGHDFALYQDLLGEAEYYKINRLCRWIKDKKYLEAVTVQLVPLEPKLAVKAVLEDESEVPIVQETPAVWHQRSPENPQTGVVRKQVVVYNHDLCVNAYRKKEPEEQENQSLSTIRNQLSRYKCPNSGGKSIRCDEQVVSPLEALD